MASIRQLAIVALFTTTATIANAASGKGTTTRYWDCCKPSCAWDKPDELESSVKSCDINDSPLTGNNDKSGCESGGVAYMCSDQSPWQVDANTAYGFAAVSAASPACCQCYKLSFTSGSVAGKTMIVQATNTGGDVGSTQFDIAMPGGGFGIFDGCSNQWGATSDVWGAQYGGSSTNTCAKFPTELQPGCDWRWDWFEGADNPTVDWETVACPAAITAKSGCVRKGDTPTGSADTAAKESTAASSSAVVEASSSAEAVASSVQAPAASSADSNESAEETPVAEETPAAGESEQTATQPASVPAASVPAGSASSTTLAVVQTPAASNSEAAGIPTSALESSATSETASEPTYANEPVPAEPSTPAGEDDSEDYDTCE